METENELNNEILKTTMLIHDKFPELSKYIIEMPVTIPDVNDPEINIKSLRKYRDSLNTLLNKFASTHGKNKPHFSNIVK